MNTNPITMTPSASITTTNYELLDGASNPCLDEIPDIPHLNAAMRALTRIRNQTGEGIEPRQLFAGNQHIHLPTIEEAKILIEVTGQVRASYSARDLRNPEYRQYSLESNQFINKPYDRHGYRIPSKGGKAPYARPRGIFVCALSGMGRHGLADAIQAFIGRGTRQARVPVEAGHLSFVQLKTLRINWPERGILGRLVRSFVAAFDTEIGTTYSSRTRGPMFREDDMVTAISALASIANLGLLIVERINTKAATTRAASETWDALGAFTRTTGIPVLCLATPGAAIGLVEQSGSIGDLASTGVHYLFPNAKESVYWKAFCKAYFETYLMPVGLKQQPSWFIGTLWDVSLGHYKQAAKACSYIAKQMTVIRETDITQDYFIQLAQKCLMLESPHLQAARLVQQGGTFKSYSIRRHGDWIPLELAIRTAPTLEFQNSKLSA